MKFPLKLALVLCVISLCSTFSPAFAQTLRVNTPALHTSGNQILNANNNVVDLHGVGVAGYLPDLIFWGTGGGDSWADQWQSASAASVTDTFQELSSVWHVNMIRVYMYPEWWYLNNISPYTESGGGFGVSGQTVSVQSYVETLASEAEQYGIYIDIAPYQLTAYSGSYISDPYLTSNMATAQGLPLMSDWDSAAQSFLASTGLTEQAFWTQFWTSMATNLKAYPNVIFEAWNEPGDGTGGNTIPAGYLSYLTTMYGAVRATGSTNLIMMQWQPGWEPNGWGQNLSWASQINTAIGGSPTGIVYTTHFYYYAPSDLSSYWNNPSQFEGATSLTNCLQLLQASMGVSAPIVINEEGSCDYSSTNTALLNWWSSLLAAQNSVGYSSGAYYWLSSSGLGGSFDGEELLTSGYTPNKMGLDYIHACAAPAPTPTPTPKPTATPKPSPTSTPKPITSPTPTPSPHRH